MNTLQIAEDPMLNGRTLPRGCRCWHSVRPATNGPDAGYPEAPWITNPKKARTACFGISMTPSSVRSRAKPAPDWLASESKEDRTLRMDRQIKYVQYRA